MKKFSIDFHADILGNIEPKQREDIVRSIETHIHAIDIRLAEPKSAKS